MADPMNPGNLAMGALCLASFGVWGWAATRLARGEQPLPMRPREPAPWPPVVVASAFPVAFLILLITAGFGPDSEGLSLTNIRIACVATGLQIASILGLLSRSGPLRAADLGIDRSNPGRETLVGLVGFLASWLPVFAVNYVISEILHWRAEGGKHSFFKILENEPGAASVAWITLSVVVLAPLSEELLYRVVLQGWMETRMRPAAAITLISLLFAAVHYSPGRPDAIPLFPLALILGYVYYRRHSYLAVVVLHGTFNAANLTFAVLYGSG